MLLLLWLVSEACQMSTSAQVAFKCLHIPLTRRQMAVINMITTLLADEFGHGFSCIVLYVEVKMVPMDAI